MLVINVHNPGPNSVHFHQDGDTKALERQIKSLEWEIMSHKDTEVSLKQTIQRISEDRNVAERTLQEARFQLSEVLDSLEDLLTLSNGDWRRDTAQKAVNKLRGFGIGGRKLPAHQERFTGGG